SPAARGLYERVRNSMDPHRVKPGKHAARDARARQARFLKLVRDAQITTPEEEVDCAIGRRPPNMPIRTPAGLIVHGALKFTLGPGLDVVAEKVVRGVFFASAGRPIGRGSQVRTHFPRANENPWPMVQRIAATKGAHQERRPGFEFVGALEGNESIWAFQW